MPVDIIPVTPPVMLGGLTRRPVLGGEERENEIRRIYPAMGEGAPRNLMEHHPDYTLEHHEEMECIMNRLPGGRGLVWLEEDEL